MSEILQALCKALDKENSAAPFNGQIAKLLRGEQVSASDGRGTVRDNRRRTSRDAANTHPHRWPGASRKSDPHLVVLSDPKSMIAEQYRNLRTRILHAKATRGFTTFLISSALPAEGKTLTAVNLAIAIAQGLEQTVLLVDADLRHLGVTHLLGLETEAGLSEYLQGTTDLAACFVRLTDRLTILPAGSQPANPTELLGSEKMATLLREVKHRDGECIVLIDTLPVFPTTDASLLAPEVDGVIFVIQAGRTPRDTARRALAQLSSAEVLGLVINDVNPLDL
jgi:protein-tyrosine kinase